MTKHIFSLQTYFLFGILFLSPLYASHKEDTLPDTYEELSDEQKNAVTEIFNTSKKLIYSDIKLFFTIIKPPKNHKLESKQKRLQFVLKNFNAKLLYEKLIKKGSKYDFRNSIYSNKRTPFLQDLVKEITGQDYEIYPLKDFENNNNVLMGTAKSHYGIVSETPQYYHNLFMTYNHNTEYTNGTEKGFSTNKPSTNIPKNDDTSNSDTEYTNGTGSSTNKQNNNYNQAEIWKIGGSVIVSISLCLIFYNISSNTSKKSKRKRKKRRAKRRYTT